MILLDVCENPDVLRVVKLIRTVIDILKIAVPIILMVSLMIDFIKPLINEKDVFSKTGKQVLERIISALLIFFIPTFMETIFLATGSNPNSYTSCINNATTENIRIAYVKQAQRYVETANKSLARGDYNAAVVQVERLENSSEKEKLQSELKEILKKIEKKEEEEREKNKPKWPIYGNWGPGGVGLIGDGFMWPLTTPSSLTACFAGSDSIHRGAHGALDIAAADGIPVYASKAGTVTYSNYPGTYPSTPKNVTNAQAQCASFGGCGNSITISHGDGTSTQYCHLTTNSLTVKKGDYVEQGRMIGRVGSSGCSTGPHLHFAIYSGGAKVNPMRYVVPYQVSNPGACN